jgi:aminoglycoside/choline kinase family phosphotransferase
VTVVLEEASLKTGTDPLTKWYIGKRSKMSVNSDEKQKFTAVICIMSSYTFDYVG